MKIALLLACSLIVAACSSTSDRVDWVDYGDDPMQNPQYVAAMTAAGTTGQQHEMLTERAGTWQVKGQSWLAPDADPTPMAATATTRSLLGGRYVLEDFRSEFMGQPFEGQLLQGFDNINAEYWSVWIDNMSTAPLISHGTETEPGRVELHGTIIDILTPAGRPTRTTVTKNDDGSYTMRMYDSREGTEEFQVMELHYTRR